jgi:membrane fusion protein (multidrug efflux system)
LDTTAPIAVSPNKKRVWIIAILAIVLVIAALAGIKVSQIRAMISAGKAMKPPPESVTTAKVEKTAWLASREAVGTLVAVRAVNVSTEVTGQVKQINFDSGALVHKGDVMVKLDTSTEDAQLASAEADLKLADVNARRARALRKTSANTPSDLDAALSRLAETQAQVQLLRATINKKTIRAPFDGRVAIRQVELGQVLSPGNTIASLQSVTPIHADFWLPQQVLSDLHVNMRAEMTTDVFPNDKWQGVVTVINPEVDVSTRNVRVRATFPNVDGRLRPGMFASVNVLSDDERQVLVIPATSVMYAPYGDSVFAVEKKDQDLIARQKFVRLGERRGDLVAVNSGLEAGETIVSSGAFKLHNGSTLVVHNELAPNAQLNPTPADK